MMTMTEIMLMMTVAETRLLKDTSWPLDERVGLTYLQHSQQHDQKVKQVSK